MNLVLLRNCLFLFSTLFSACLSACTILPYFNWQQGQNEGESLEVLQNQGGLNLKWKRNVGTIRPLNQNSGYLTGIGPVIYNGYVFFLSWPDDDKKPIISTLDLGSGNVISEYPLMSASKYPSAPCLECILNESKNKLLISYIFNNFMHVSRSDSKDFRLISRIQKFSYPLLSFPLDYWNGNLIIFKPNLVQSWNPDTLKLNWEVHPYRDSGLELSELIKIVDGDQLFLTSEKLIDSKWTRIVSSIDLSNGKLLWNNEFGNLYYVKYGYGMKHAIFDEEDNKIAGPATTITDMWVDENVYTFRITYLIEKKIWSGKLMAFNRRTGTVLWEKSDILPSFALGRNNLSHPLFINKSENPEAVYQLDPLSGAETKSIFLPGRQDNLYPIYIHENTIVYVMEAETKDNVPSYRYVGIDTVTGKQKWAFNIEKPSEFPKLEGEILYFFDRGVKREPWFKNDRKSGSDRPSSYNDESKLSNEALALDIKTGEILWQIRLVGGGKPLIENLIIKDNHILVKSLSGWLYSLEMKNTNSVDLKSRIGHGIDYISQGFQGMPFDIY